MIVWPRFFKISSKQIFDRRLHLIGYDLRWRQAEETNLVRWCLDIVGRSDYFVGILGCRYGWRPPDNGFGQANDQQLSITEMEIDYARRHIPPSRRFFCFADLESDSQELLAAEAMEDRQALAALKQRLRHEQESVFTYGDSQALLTIIQRELIRIFAEDYPAGQKVELETYRRSEALAEIIEEKRRGFVGQKDHLEQLAVFCLGNSERNYLAIHAVAGAGKSALLAQFIHHWRCEHPQIAIIAHYMSMAGDSRSVQGVMHSLGEQLQQAGLIGTELEALPDRLAGQVRQALINCKLRLVVAIDGLDEIAQEGEDLAWLPQWLPPQVRVLITTRPVAVLHRLLSYPGVSELALPPLDNDEIRAIIAYQRQRHQLSLTAADIETLVGRAAGSPLFLKVALDEMAAGGIAVAQLAETVEALFHQILLRLRQQYGESVIENYLGLIAAGRNGLSEAELREILTKDFRDRVGDDFWLRVQHSLAHFVILREKLLSFFHPEFERSVKMLLGRNRMREFHRRLAGYFSDKGYAYERTLFELAYQLQWSEQYSGLLRLFGAIHFWESCCRNGMLPGLRNDLEFAINAIAVPIPDQLQVEIEKDVICCRDILVLLARLIDFDFHFLLRHPETLRQCLWNRGYWHDSPAAAFHYRVTGSQPPWERPGPKLYRLVDHWRCQPQSQSSPWVKSRRPLPERLDSSMLKIFRGHEDMVTGVAMNRQGTQIISGSWDKTIRLWDRSSGQCLLVLKGHQDYLSSVRFSPEQRRIISSSGDGSVRIWDVYSGRCLRRLSGHDKAVTSVAISANERIVSASKDKTLRIWDAVSGDCLRVLTGHTKTINSVFISADGTRILSGAWDNTIRLWDAASGECLLVIRGHSDDVKSVCLSDDGRFIVSASKDATARLWDAGTGECLQVFEHPSMVFSVALSADGRKLATGVYGTVRLWDTTSGRCLLKLEGHESAVFGLFISADGDEILSSSSDKTIRLWDATGSQYSMDLLGHEDDVRSVALSLDASTVASGSKDGTVRIWEAETGICRATLSDHDGKIRGIYLAADGHLASGGSDKTVRLWHLSDSQCRRIWHGHSKMVLCVFIADNGQMVVSGGRDKSVRLWNFADERCLAVLSGHDEDVRCVYASVDARTIVSGSEDKTIRVWDVESAACRLVLKGHQEAVLSVAITPDNRQIFSAGRDNTMRVWDAASGDCLSLVSGWGEVSQWLRGTDYYVVATDVETVVRRKSDQHPLAFFPSLVRQASIAANTIIGYAGIYLYDLEFTYSGHE